MTSRYETLPYAARFKEDVIRLQSHLWSDTPSLNRAYFEWKYERSPFVGAPLIQLILHKGEVVAMRGFWGSEWLFGSPPASTIVLCAGDTVIDPSHRNRGLLTILLEIEPPQTEGERVCRDFVLNLSASRTTRLASLVAGWRTAGSLHKWTWSNTGTDGTSSFDRFDERAAASRRADSGGLRVRVTSEADADAMAEALEGVAYDGRLRHSRDREFLEWRYDNPLSEYRFLYWGAERCEAYVVLQCFRTTKRAPQVNVVDWSATTSRSLADLLETALRWGKFARINTWSTKVEPTHATALTQAGFQETRKELGLLDSQPAILVRAHSKDGAPASWLLGEQPLLDVGSWNLRMIDSDGY